MEPLRIPLIATVLVYLLFHAVAVHPYSRSIPAKIPLEKLFALIKKCSPRGTITYYPSGVPSLKNDLSKALCDHFKFDPTELDLDSTIESLSPKLTYMHKTHSKKRRISGGARIQLEKRWSKESCDINVFFKSGAAVRKRLATQLETERAKNSDLTTKNAALKKRIPNLLKMVAQLKRKNAGVTHRGSSKVYRLTAKEYSPRNLARKKASFVAAVKNALTVVGNEQFKVLSVDFEDRRGRRQSIQFNRPSEINAGQETVSVNDINLLNTIVLLKDTHMISLRAYHDLCKTCTNLPKSYKIRERIAELNSRFCITSTPGQYPGVQQKIKNTLEMRIRQDLSSGKLNPNSPVIRMKVAGDGTCIGKRLHVVTFGYSLLNDFEVQSAIQLLAVVKCPESYRALEESLADVIADLKETKEILIDEKLYKIELFLGGDLKFLNCVLGLQANNGKYSCIYCLCPSDKRHDTTMQWGLSRTIQSIKDNAQSKKLGCVNNPLFDFIPVDHVVPDLLHLFLRITDRLISKVVWELRLKDNISRSTSSFDPLIHNNLSKFEQPVKSFGVTFKISIDGTGKITFTDLPVPQRLKVMRGLRLSELCGDNPRIAEIQQLWIDFLALYDRLHTAKTSDDAQQFDHAAKTWVNRCCNDIYLAKDAICYIHLLGHHVSSMIALHGNFSTFAQQKFEYLNHELTQAYFRS